MSIKPAVCKTCSNQLIRWGKTASGKKRFRCATCKSTRLYRRTSSLAILENDGLRIEV